MDRRLFLAGATPLLALSACKPLLPAQKMVATEGRTTTLLAAAREQTRHLCRYDGGYTRIGYPMGDVPLTQGACTDVVIRAYRALGVDLQQLVHEDMLAHFDLYPKRWGLAAPDSNIDHRRVPNLMVFFARFATVLPVSDRPADFKPGDLVTNRPGGGTHIAIVSNRQSMFADRLMVIQNCGWGPREDDQLFSYPMMGHYRFSL